MHNATIIRLLAILGLILSGIPAGAEEIGLRCEMTGGGEIYLLFEPDERAVALVLETDSVDGDVDVTETHYRFRFPKTDTRWETQITVNKLSGELTWEHGRPPFESASDGNVMRNGECRRIESKSVGSSLVQELQGDLLTTIQLNEWCMSQKLREQQFCQAYLRGVYETTKCKYTVQTPSFDELKTAFVTWVFAMKDEAFVYAVESAVAAFEQEYSCE